MLIPYSHFYQSGVAVRALELGVPVIGPRHPFLIDLLGPDSPGFVDAGNPARWADAIVRASARVPELQERALLLRERCEAAWDTHLS